MKAIIPISGGADSSTCIALAKSRGYDVYAMFINYGQNNLTHEIKASRDIADYYEVLDFKILDLSWFHDFGGTGLTNHTDLNLDNKILEYVPFRNTIILSIAVAWAEAIDADAVYYGSTGAPWITPDNSPEYFEAFRNVVNIGTIKKGIHIESPFNEMSKTEVVKLGLELGVPFQLTWSCHNNNIKHCGKCSQCLDRLNAFKNNGLLDPVFE